MSEGQDKTSLTAAQSGWKWAKRVLRGLSVSMGIMRKATVLIALIVSLLFNGLLIFSSTVSGAVSAMAATMGLRTVAARQANELTRTSVELATERAARDTAERTNRRQANEITRITAELGTIKGRTSAQLAAERAARDTAEEMNRRQANEIARITAELGVIKGRANTITGRVNKRWQNAATREIAAMPAEALPLVGVGVIVAATAWEINDMCATVRDMAELERLFDPSMPDSEEVATVCGKEVPNRSEMAAALSESPGETWDWVRGTFTDFEWPDLSQDDVNSKAGKIWNDIKQTFEDQHENIQLWLNGDEGKGSVGIEQVSHRL